MPEADEQPKIRVAYAGSEATRRRALSLAEELGLPLRALADTTPDELIVRVEEGCLSLARGGLRGPGTRPDWNARMSPARSSSRAPRDPLLRALGKSPRTVLDATAGFGDDAFVMARAGHEVIAVERSPIVGCIFEDALVRARDDARLAEAAARIKLHVTDARTLLRDDSEVRASIATVYLDPMFPPKRKRSALPRLAMQLLQELVGSDDDFDELFALARQCERVVVKRPPHSPPVAPGASATHEGKLVRYDVYLRRPSV